MLERIKFTRAIAPSAGVAGTTTLNGATLDMANFEGVVAEVTFGVITAGALTTIKIQQGAASDLSDAADLLGSAQTVADTNDDGIFLADFSRVRERYARVVVTRSTQNAVVSSANYLQYGPRRVPVTSQGTGVISSEESVGPAEGTA